MLFEQMILNSTLCEKFTAPDAKDLGRFDLKVFLKDVRSYVGSGRLIAASRDETWMSFEMTITLPSIFSHLHW